jgi:transposase
MTSDLYWLTDEQMARLQPYFRRAMAGRGSMIGGF